MVKLATTKAQRKLFFNLRSMKQSLKEDAADADTHRSTLTAHEVDVVARELNVKREDVLEMETRMSGGDVALEPQVDDGDESYAPIAYLADEAANRRACSKRSGVTGWPATASLRRSKCSTRAVGASSKSAG